MGDEPVKKTTEEKFDFILQRVYFGILSVGLLAIIYFNLVGALGTMPGYCGLCHGPSYTAWKASAHGETKCSTCHGGTSAFGFVSGRLSLARMIPAQLTAYYKRPVTTTVSNDKCLGCHSHIVAKTIENGLLKVSHKEIISAGYECTHCHSTVVHGKAAIRKNVAEMEKCLSCHNGTAASGACDKCHIKADVVGRTERINGTWQITHGANWRKTHGMGNLSTCQTCHSKLYCSRCHNTELPHSTGWLATHGKELKGSPEAQKSCMQCHRGALCQNCHSMPMPHPNTFLVEHSKIVKEKGNESCYGCHLKEACTKCHTYHTHPGIPKDKLKLLRKEAGLD